MKKPSDTGHPRKALFEALAQLKNADEVEALMGDLCTPTEMDAFADRWHAARLLAQGNTQRSVAETTHISITTVTRVARFLHHGFGGYQLLLSRMGLDKRNM